MSDAASSVSSSRQPWLVLGVIALAQLMVVLDISIVNIALPSAQADLGFADDDRQWIVTAYALAFGSLLLLGGRLGDLFGRKRTFIAGLIGFAGASTLGGAAPDLAVLTAARALQGAFGALLAPAALALLTTTFTGSKDRGRAFAVIGAVASGGGAIGLLLGGALTSYLSWRWCLWVNLVFAGVAVAGAVRYVVNPGSGERSRLDITGTAMASLGLFGVVFGFSQAGSHGWRAGTTISSLCIGVALLAAFVYSQSKVASPLLPLRIVTDRSRAGAYLAVVLASVAVFGLFLFLTFFLQGVQGLSPVRTGLAFLPAPVGIVVASTVANTRLIPRLGARAVIVSGLVLAGTALSWLTQLTPTSGYPEHVLPSLVLGGLGFGSIFAPAINVATAGAAPADAGAASALVNTMQQIGGSLGTALLSTLAADGAASYFAARHGAAVAAATHGYTVAFAVSAAILLTAAVVCGALIHTPRQSQHSTTATD